MLIIKKKATSIRKKKNEGFWEGSTQKYNNITPKTPQKKISVLNVRKVLIFTRFYYWLNPNL